MNYKIAETFDSIQGEGVWAGARMYFIRLAGCNVGKYIAPDDVNNSELKLLREVHVNHSVCRTALGQEFLCDTDYRGIATHTVEELIDMSGDAPILCVTGGEPAMWDLNPLINGAWQVGKRVHMETSGTLKFRGIPDWITCSPKLGFLEENLVHAHEWKFVIGNSLGNPREVADKIVKFTKNAQSKHVYLSPENGVTSLDQHNFEFALEVLKCEPSKHWRICTQIQKVWGIR